MIVTTNGKISRSMPFDAARITALPFGSGCCLKTSRNQSCRHTYGDEPLRVKKYSNRP